MKDTISENFTKTTNVVVVFKKPKVFKNDCDKLREILGKAFPEVLELSDTGVVEDNYHPDRWLMKEVIGYDGTPRLEKWISISANEKHFLEAGIDVNSLNPDRVRIFAQKQNKKKYNKSEITNCCFENFETFKSLYDELRYQNNILSRLDIYFRTYTTTVRSVEGEVTGNFFEIQSTSNTSEEKLKFGHKKIVQRLLEVLEPIDEIEKISYYCGDIEHEVKSKVACVLD